MTRYAYRVSEALPYDSPVYIHRKADDDLLEAVVSGQFCGIVGPRQTGKSSLSIQTKHRLTQMGYRCITLFATELIDSPQDYHRWDKQLASIVWDSLHPTSVKPLQQWLQKTNHLLPQQRLERLAGDLLANELAKKPTVLFIDAAETLLQIPYLANDLCDWIWHCQCLRKIYPLYQNLRFVIIGSAASTKLIQNTALLESLCEIIPQNFELSETIPLQQGFSDRITNPEIILASVLRWTHGQPALTQKVCDLLKTTMDEVYSSKWPLTPFTEAIDQWIDHIVQSRIIANWNRQDDLSHLWNMYYQLMNSPHQQQIRSIYHQVLTDQVVELQDSPPQRELINGGFVVSKNGQLKNANEIYRHVFSSLVTS